MARSAYWKEGLTRVASIFLHFPDKIWLIAKAMCKWQKLLLFDKKRLFKDFHIYLSIIFIARSISLYETFPPKTRSNQQFFFQNQSKSFIDLLIDKKPSSLLCHVPNTETKTSLNKKSFMKMPRFFLIPNFREQLPPKSQPNRANKKDFEISTQHSWFVRIFYLYSVFSLFSSLIHNWNA